MSRRQSDSGSYNHHHNPRGGDSQVPDRFGSSQQRSHSGFTTQLEESGAEYYDDEEEFRDEYDNSNITSELNPLWPRRIREPRGSTDDAIASSHRTASGHARRRSGKYSSLETQNDEARNSESGYRRASLDYAEDSRPTRRSRLDQLRRLLVRYLTKRSIIVLVGLVICITLLRFNAQRDPSNDGSEEQENYSADSTRPSVTESSGIEPSEYEKSSWSDLQTISPPWYPAPRGGIYSDWSESYAKAATLVDQMSLLEKVNITTGTGWQMGMCVGNTGPASGVNFPSLCLQDGPLGIRFADLVTAGPAGITLGATWNRDLAYKRGRLLGIEARKKGVNVLLGPSVGPIGRTAASGRNWEGFGVDPVLQSAFAVETISGIQDEGVMATVKHFIGNEQEHFRKADEWNLERSISTTIDDRTLHELYAWPFADAIRAGVASVMCSYNHVNDSQACQNSKLLNGIIKDEMGFQGFVQSDWLAQCSGVASALAGLDMSMPGDGRNWADGISLWGPDLTLAVLNGSLPLERLDDMVLRVVAAWYQLGQDNKDLWPAPPPDGDGGPNFSSWTDQEYGLLRPGSNDKTKGQVNRRVDPTIDSSFSHSALARRIAAEGVVLLKNEENRLPLALDGTPQSSKQDEHGREYKNRPNLVQKTRIAIYGEDADLSKKGINFCADHVCNEGTLAMGWGSGTAQFPYLVSPWKALSNTLNESAVDLSLFATNKPPKAGDRALMQQDLCFVFVNADSGEGYAKYQNIAGDRNDLKTQKGGDDLINAVSAQCGQATDGGTKGKTIVVVHSVGPLLLESFIESPAIGAVLWANLPGQESGNALADILFGRMDPSGHLPFTIARTEEDYGPAGKLMLDRGNGRPSQNFEEGLLVDYRWFDEHNVQPRFEFGFGLSYTTFELADLTVHVEQNPRPAPFPPVKGPDLEPPELRNSTIPSARDAVFPANWRKLKKYIYPYISSELNIKPDQPHYPVPESDLPTFRPSEASGASGGNPYLWETVARVELTVSNTGRRTGNAVIQLYLTFPTDLYDTANEALDSDASLLHTSPRSLRAFAKVHLRGAVSQVGDDAWYTTGESKRVAFELTRRDLSFWSARYQNWVLPQTGDWGIEVGFSSRDIRERGSIVWK